MDSIFASKTGIICLVSYVQNQCSGVDEEFALQLDLPCIPTYLCLALNDGVFMDSCLMKLTGRCTLHPWVQDGAGANRKKRKQRNTEPSHTITKCLLPPPKKQKPLSEPTNLSLEPA